MIDINEADIPLEKLEFGSERAEDTSFDMRSEGGDYLIGTSPTAAGVTASSSIDRGRELTSRENEVRSDDDIDYEHQGSEDQYQVLNEKQIKINK